MPISQITGASIQDGSIVVADLGITTFNTGTGNTLTLQANSATGLVIDVTGNTAIANSLSFSSTGARIRGDFSNATVASRVMFQTSTANSATSLYAIPSGTSTTSQFVAVSNSDPTNASILQLLALSTEAQIRSGITGTGTLLPLTMYTGGSERLRIDTSGNVGIGTASPVEKLTVTGQISTSTDLVLKESTTARGYIFGTSAGLTYRATSTLPHIFQNVGTELMRLDATGNLGIGTASPSQRLHVAAGTILASNTSSTSATVAIAGNGSTVGTSAFELIQGGSSEAYVYNRANSYLVLGTNNTERMRIVSTGKVGIATNSPYGTLEVLDGGQTSGANPTTFPTINIVQGSAALNTNGGLDFRGSAFGSGYGFRISAIDSSGVHLVFGNRQNSTTFTEVMRLDSSGNVGINTSSPSQKLTVNNGALFAQGASDWFGIRGNSQTIPPSDNGSNAVFAINGNYSGGNGEMNIWNTNTTLLGGFRFMQKTGTSTFNDVLYMKGDGNVGIGTSSPAMASTSYRGLEIFGNTLGSQLKLTNSTTGSGAGNGYDLLLITGGSDVYLWNREAAAQIFGTNDTERMRIASSGALGFNGANYGSSGQALVSNGSGSTPSWQSVGASAGQIIQVLQATNNTIYTVSGSGAFTGLSITITPRNSSSRFLLMCGMGQVSQGGGSSTMAFNFARNGTSLNYISGGSYNGIAVFVDNQSNFSPIMPFFSLIDSPATASAITYTVIYSTDGTKWIGKRGADSYIAASQQFQVLEIAG